MNQQGMILHTRVVSGTGGGPDKTILRSAQWLAAAGYSVGCLYLRHPDDPGYRKLESQARLRQVDLISVDDFGPLDLKLPARLRDRCSGRSIWIWHAHDYKSNLLGLLLRRSRPMCLVSTVHGWVKQTVKTPLYYLIDRLCLKRYDAVLCVSQDLVDRCIEVGVPAARCSLVPNALDAGEFYRRRRTEEAKRDGSIPPGRLVVGAVGRLSPEKGFQLLIEAAGRLIGEGQDMELWIVGEGEERSALESKVVSLDLGERVRFLGFKTDVRPLYEAMDVFVVSSLREGLPNVALEAMAMEVPVLSTRIAGIPSLITDGSNGVVVEPGSVSALASGLRRLLGDPDARLRLARAGRETVETSFNFDLRMERILEIYEATCRSRAGSR